jgi:HEAT repeat protein
MYNDLQRNLMKKVFILTIILSFIITTRAGYAQPKLPVETIPANIPAEVIANIKLLYSKNPVEQVNAASALGKLGGKAKNAVPFLISMLDDSEFVLQQSDPSIKVSTSPAKEAMAALISIGSPAVEPLITALKDENTDRRKYAAEALGNIRDARTIEPLIAALSDRRTIVRDNAYKALLQTIERFKEDRDDEQLIDMLNYDDSSLRHATIEALGNIPTSHVDKIVLFLGNRDSSVRKDASDALKKIGKVAVVPLINALYKNDDIQIRINAVMILKDIDDPLAVEPLIDTLKDKPLTSSLEADTLRFEAAKALGNIRDARAIEPLIAALSDENFKVRGEAAEALSKIGEPSVEPLIKLLKVENTDQQISAAKILGDIKDPRAVEPLIRHLLLAAADNKAWNFRLEATRALGKIKDHRAVEPLEIMLSDRVQSVREMAEWSLNKISDQTYERQKKKEGFWEKLF